MTSPDIGAGALCRTPGRVIAPRNWRDQFLALLAQTANVTQAATAARISLSCVYRTRREDRGFARAWQSALCEGYDNLELALLQRLLAGEPRDGDGRKFDNATAFRLLMAHRESAARERAQRDNESEEEILARIKAKLVAMRTREKEAAALLDAPKPATDDRPDTLIDGQ